MTGPRLQIAVDMLSQTGGHGDEYFPCGFDVPCWVLRDVHAESVSRAVAAGVKVAMGTDAGVGPHREAGHRIV